MAACICIAGNRRVGRSSLWIVIFEQVHPGGATADLGGITGAREGAVWRGGLGSRVRESVAAIAFCAILDPEVSVAGTGSRTGGVAHAAVGCAFACEHTGSDRVCVATLVFVAR
jgi:hypothetical protein